MGFRSDIYIKCKKEKIFEFKHFLQTYKEKYDIDLQKEEDLYSDDNYLYLILRNWKFYIDCQEVNAVKDFVEREDMEEHIGMIVINENDTKDEWGWHYEVDLSISIRIEGM